MGERTALEELAENVGAVFALGMRLERVRGRARGVDALLWTAMAERDAEMILVRRLRTTKPHRAQWRATLRNLVSFTNREWALAGRQLAAFVSRLLRKAAGIIRALRVSLTLGPTLAPGHQAALRQQGTGSGVCP